MHILITNGVIEIDNLDGLLPQVIAEIVSRLNALASESNAHAKAVKEVCVEAEKRLVRKQNRSTRESRARCPRESGTGDAEYCVHST